MGGKGGIIITAEIPEDVKKRMVEFFMKTSIPRILEEMKARNSLTQRRKNYNSERG